MKIYSVLSSHNSKISSREYESYDVARHELEKDFKRNLKQGIHKESFLSEDKTWGFISDQNGNSSYAVKLVETNVKRKRSVK